jgi:hypothetical protein
VADDGVRIENRLPWVALDAKSILASGASLQLQGFGLSEGDGCSNFSLAL